MSSMTRRLAPVLGCLFCLLLLPGCLAGVMRQGPGTHRRYGASSGLAAFAAAADLVATIAYVVEASEPPPPPPPVAYYPAPPQSARGSAANVIDEPALARPAAPAPAVPPAVELPSVPGSAEVKRVMSALEPELRRCSPSAHPGWVKVALRVEAGGTISSASVSTPMEPSVRRCVEQGLARARLSPIAGGPVSLAYLLDLR